MKKVGGKRLVAANANHSQKLGQSPFIPWIIAKKVGQISLVHCNCIAGLGESYTNVTSLLWVIAIGVQRRESQTVTNKCIG